MTTRRQPQGERCDHGRLALRCERCRAAEIQAMNERVLALSDQERTERAATYHDIFREQD